MLVIILVYQRLFVLDSLSMFRVYLCSICLQCQELQSINFIIFAIKFSITVFGFGQGTGGGDNVDSNVLPYCSINKAEKKTIGEMEQEFLQAMQVTLHKPSFL